MIPNRKRIEAFDALGTFILNALSHPQEPEFERLHERIAFSFHRNGWFTEDEVKYALAYWGGALTKGKLLEWLAAYPSPKDAMRVGLILPGNIPLVGMHDVVCTILTGHFAQIKCSSSDDVLLPFLLGELVRIEPEAASWFAIHDHALKQYDAAIATGSNNSARHFEAYFKDIPHLIRGNRTSVAILDGTETEAELNGLMHDAFRYYGLGCRNVTHLLLPQGFDLNKIFAASLPFQFLQNHKKYANNYAYHRTLMMMEQRDVLENEIVLLSPSAQLYSPVSVLHYQFYDTINEAKSIIEMHESQVQCVVGHEGIAFGTAQSPALNDYADGIDTVDFLVKLRPE
jgi:hypothetical protein